MTLSISDIFDNQLSVSLCLSVCLSVCLSLSILQFRDKTVEA